MLARCRPHTLRSSSLRRCNADKGQGAGNGRSAAMGIARPSQTLQCAAGSQIPRPLNRRQFMISLKLAARGIPFDIRIGIERVSWNLIRIIPAKGARCTRMYAFALPMVAA